MKNSAPAPALLTPQPEGWLLQPSTGQRQLLQSLGDATQWLTADQPLHMALPSSSLLLERFTLPASQREELNGMARLQLEKSLPFAMEEVASDFAVVRGEGNETTVMSMAISHGALEDLCRPLRESRRLPRSLTPYVCHVAAVCPAAEIVLTLHTEHGHLVMAISEYGKLGWAHVLPNSDAGQLFSELPQLLLVAGMQGASTTFARVLIAPECEALAPELREYFKIPVEPLPAVGTRTEAEVNLVPAGWQAEERAEQRRRKTQRWLLAGATVVLLVVAAAMVDIALLSRQAGALTKRIAAAQPALQRVQSLQSRSAALAPAIDHDRYAVEILHLLQRNLPSALVQLTEFDLRRDQWRVVGEAPSASLAIDYLQRLKADADLSVYEINAGPPQLAGNDRAQFDITGKR